MSNKLVPEELNFENMEDMYQEVPFNVPGDDEPYKLVTINGHDATEYQNAQAKTLMRNVAGDVVGLKDIANLEPMLLKMSIRDSQGSKISPAKFSKWSFPIQRKLFETAQQISRLNQETRASKMIAEAFDMDNEPPCTLQEMREWTKTLDKDKFRSIQLLFSATDEELAKNGQSSSTDGSD